MKLLDLHVSLEQGHCPCLNLPCQRLAQGVFLGERAAGAPLFYGSFLERNSLQIDRRFFFDFSQDRHQKEKAGAALVRWQLGRMKRTHYCGSVKKLRSIGCQF